jgi:hypothetical protein
VSRRLTNEHITHTLLAYLAEDKPLYEIIHVKGPPSSGKSHTITESIALAASHQMIDISNHWAIDLADLLKAE